MTAPIARTSVIGTIEKGERKDVNGKALVEFYIVDFGLRINAWGDMADVVPGVGSYVLVEGATRTRKYKNAQQEDRQTTEITASSITPVDGVEAIDNAPKATVQHTPEPVAKLPAGGF